MAGLPPFRGSPVGDLKTFLRDVATFLRLLAANPLLSGQFVRVTLDGTTNVQTFRHSLGRPYRGVISAGDGVSGSSVYLRRILPETAEALGVDVTAFFAVQPTSASTATFYLLVF